MLTVERLSEVRIGDVEKMAYELRDGVVCGIVSKKLDIGISWGNHCLKVVDYVSGEARHAYTEATEYAIARNLLSILQTMAWLR